MGIAPRKRAVMPMQAGIFNDGKAQRVGVKINTPEEAASSSFLETGEDVLADDRQWDACHQRAEPADILQMGIGCLP